MQELLHQLCKHFSVVTIMILTKVVPDWIKRLCQIKDTYNYFLKGIVKKKTELCTYMLSASLITCKNEAVPGFTILIFPHGPCRPTVYPIVIFSNRYVDSDCRNFQPLYSRLLIERSDHHHTTQTLKFNNFPSSLHNIKQCLYFSPSFTYRVNSFPMFEIFSWKESCYQEYEIHFHHHIISIITVLCSKIHYQNCNIIC